MTKPTMPDRYDWQVEVDEITSPNLDGQPALCLYVIDLETDETVAWIGAVDVRYSISDHGNIHVHHEDEDYLISVALELLEECEP